MQQNVRSNKLVTTAFRCLYIVAIGTSAWSDQTASPLQQFWNTLKLSAFIRHNTCEPLVVMIAFAVSIGGFYLLDTRLRWFHRWHIHKAADMRHWQFEGQGGRLKEALLYILPLAVADWFYPRRSLPDTAPGLLQLAGQVLSALLVYDALFTVVHLLCHKVPWLYRHIHAKHHTKPVQRACEAVRLSAAEEILDVGCSVAALNLLKCHPMARLVYNIVIVYLITELHSGYDFPWSLENVVPFGLWAGSRRHEAHHRHGRLYYQKFFLPVLSEGKMMSFSKSKGSSARQDQLDNQKTRNRMGMEALSIGG